MKVRAKTLGYYGDMRRREGDIFDLVERTVGDKDHRRTLTAEQQFSETWMERVGAPGKSGESTQSESPETHKETSKPSKTTKRKSNVI